jgi:integrase
MARKRSGQLVWRVTMGWCARITVWEEGERVRRMVELGTRSRLIARRKLKRLLESDNDVADVAIDGIAAAPLTVRDAAAAALERWEADGLVSAPQRRSSLQRYAFGCDPNCDEDHRHVSRASHHIGELAVEAVRAHEIESVLRFMKDEGLQRQTVTHVRRHLRAIFDELWRAEQIATNPVDKARMPSMAKDERDRAVLTEGELVAYLEWQHPDERHQLAVQQRQTMAVISWCFGGLRAGELHAMRWEDFDVPTFTRGVVRRKKTKKLQPIAVPEPMRPFLLAWWDAWGRPGEGLVFPALRGDQAGRAAKHGVSHAKALRRDLQRALGLEVWTGRKFEPSDLERTSRHRELFDETETSKPVDFHSFRRAAAGALAAAGVNEQTAMTVLSHTDPKTHARYWAQAMGAVEVPAAALPSLPPPSKGTAAAFSCSTPRAGSKKRASKCATSKPFPRAGYQVRTGDPQLGKLMLYQLS